MLSPFLLIAAKDLRGDLSKFWIFLICLFLGVFAISFIGNFKKAIEVGLEEESAEILGGDITLTLAYRGASEDELIAVREISKDFSEIISFRTMISSVLKENPNQGHALAQAKGIDYNYPLYGDLVFEPSISIEAALSEKGGIYGLLAEPSLIKQLQLQIGSLVRMGNSTYQLRGKIEHLPDVNSNTFSLGSKIIVSSASLNQTGLIEPGTLYETNYYVKTTKADELENLKSSFMEKFHDRGFRWRDRRNPAPGINSIVNRLSFFLTVLGIAGLIIGGVGVSTAIDSYLGSKRGTMATLKTLGATSSILTKIYLSQVVLLALCGSLLGALTGSLICIFLKPVLLMVMPLPMSFTFYLSPVIHAITLGLLISLIFSIIPLMKACREKVSDLFRSKSNGRKYGRPTIREFFYVSSLVAALVFLVLIMAPEKSLALWFIIGTLLSFLILNMMSNLIQKASKKLVTLGKIGNLLPLKLTLASIGNENGENKSVLMSIGIGLIVLATMGQIERNLQVALANDIPTKSPAYFLLDIQTKQKDALINLLQEQKLTTDIKTAPMLRGFITEINGQRVTDTNIEHWSLRGDRGITYETIPTTAKVITSGKWWPPNYTGLPQISFAQNEGQELGLDLGDTMTVNILGRDLTGTITSFRDVNFATMGINFLMVFDPHSLSSAPHTHIATVYATKEAEPTIINTVTNNFPNVTSIPVRMAINKVKDTLSKLSMTIKWCAVLIIFMGFFVIIGALAASEQHRSFEASVLKTLGAKKIIILLSFGLRSLIVGSVAGIVSLAISSVMAWVVVSYFLKSTFNFHLASGFWVVLIGISVTVVTSAAFAIGPLNSKPARILRTED